MEYGERWQSEAATWLSLRRDVVSDRRVTRDHFESKAVSPLRSATALHIAPWICLLLLCLSCSRNTSTLPLSTSGIESNHFAILETELSPAILVHSKSKYLSFLAETWGPSSHIAFATRNGPRSFRRGERLKADELEECWLLLWGQAMAPWVVYLQHKPLALSLDTNGLHLSFANGAGDVAVLPLHGSSTNVDTKKWPEFLTREPLLRIRFWASALREFPFECQTTIVARPPEGGTTNSNTVHQSYRYHSIRDHWNTKPLQIAPIPPPLAAMVSEPLKRKLMDLEMPTPFGSYKTFEGSQWTASFPSAATLTETNGAWVNLGSDKLPATNTALIHALHTDPHPRIPTLGTIRPARDLPLGPRTETHLNPSSRLISVHFNTTEKKPADL